MSAILDKHIAAIKRDIEKLRDEEKQLKAARVVLVGTGSGVSERKRRRRYVDRARAARSRGQETERTEVRTETPQQRGRRVLRNAATGRTEPPPVARRASSRVSSKMTKEQVETQDRAPRGGRLREALEVISAYPEVPSAELSRRLGLPRDRGYRIAKTLARKNLIVGDNSGWRTT